MADKKISALTSASTPLAGTEVLPIVQSGSTVKVATLDVTGGVYIGKGASNLASNTVVGNAAFTAVTTGSQSVIVGQSAAALTTNGIENTVVGQEAFYTNVTGSYNAAFGRDSLVLSTSSKNSGFGWHSGYNLTSGSNNAFWGYDAQPSTAAVNNEYTYGDANVTKHRFVGGDLVIGTSGKGIDFSATSHPAGMTSELLSDYEEGTWTPVIRGSGTAGTYEQVVTRALYTKVGRQVTLQCYITLAAVVTGGGTGYLQITGAPFTAFSPNQFPATILLTDMAKSLTTLYVGVSFANTTIMYCPEVQPTAYADFPIANAVANKTIQFTMTYFTA